MEQRKKARIGASLVVRSLAAHRDWLVSGQRDLELQDPVLPGFLDGDVKAHVREIKSILSGYTGRIGIHGPFIGISLVAGFDKRIAEAVIARYRQALEVAEELEAHYMVIHSPFIGFGASPFAESPLPKGIFNERAYAHVIIDTILEDAMKAKCMLVIENIQDNNTAQLCGLVRSFDSEYVRVSVDVGHAFITHQKGGQTPDQWIRDAGPLLAHMHIQDSDGQDDRHWAPGFGAVNWHGIFEELDALEQQPRLILELKNHADIELGAEYLAQRGYVE
jgi:sugar phosphate isomerase/epimerase